MSPWSGYELQEGRDPLVSKGQREKSPSNTSAMCAMSIPVWYFKCPCPLLTAPFLAGICGFLTFGAGVEQDVLMSYPSNDIPVALARAFIILCVLTSYPILHFCGR